MKKVWIAQNTSRWVSVDLDEIESFYYKHLTKSDTTYLYINNKRIVKDVDIELFCSLEDYLVNRLSSNEEVTLEKLLKRIEISNEERTYEEA